MQIRKLHEWNITIDEAKAVQERLGRRVRLRPLRLGTIRRVAGADISVCKNPDRLVAAVVVLTFPALEVVEVRTAAARPPFPYVPGYLSFREIPVLIDCFRELANAPDVVLCDGQGIAHPRRFGLASHLGLTLRLPAVGCAKSRLVGEYGGVGDRRGEYARLTLDGRQVGSVLRTRGGVKPLFVSPGHRADFPSSRRITLACLTRYRLPEPTRLAHIEAGKQKHRVAARRFP
jgi:deoxyribonuclease V